MEVKIPRRVADTYKRACKRAFPKEEYAVILGVLEGEDVYRIVEFYFPEDRLEYASDSAVQPQPAWWNAAKARADALNLVAFGDIHSHPFDDDEHRLDGGASLGNIAAPSTTDLNNSMALMYLTSEVVPIFGICAVRRKNGRLSSQIHFWPATPAIKVTII